MTLLIIVLSALISSILGISGLRTEAAQKKFIIKFLYYALLLFSFIILISEFLGLRWHNLIQVSAFVFIFCFILLRISTANFWGKICNHCWLVILSIFGGYLYAANQIPYPERPYSDVSSNQPTPISIDSLEKIAISGLPINTQFKQVWRQQASNLTSPVLPQNKKRSTQSIAWKELQTIMSDDSHIRSVLHNLKEQQKQELSTFLSQLNSKSVNDTRMHRYALDNRKITELYNEKAISYSRYHTITSEIAEKTPAERR